MALGKVEICGVNTSKLPVLKNEEKQALFAVKSPCSILDRKSVV